MYFKEPKPFYLISYYLGLGQALLGMPFLLHAPISYLSRSFQFSRVFFYKWTVNWRFLSESTFLSIAFSRFLLLAHATVLFIFVVLWCRGHGGIARTISRGLRTPRRPAALGRKPLTPNCEVVRTWCPATSHVLADSRSHCDNPVRMQPDWNHLRKNSTLPILGLVRTPSRFFWLGAHRIQQRYGILV